MKYRVEKTGLEAVKPFRDLFLKQTTFQFVYNKCHGAGWADVYGVHIDGVAVGYASVWGKDKREERDAIFEFFLLQPYRKYSGEVFTELVAVSGASFVECQTNDLFLTSLLYEYTKHVNVDAILFEEHLETAFVVEGAVFRKKEEEYVLELDGEVVATGGFVFNYNFPFIDMYYEVKEGFRRRGLAGYFVQELRREAYRMNRVPAARCNVRNRASRATLLKAGMRVCGYIVVGEIIR